VLQREQPKGAAGRAVEGCCCRTSSRRVLQREQPKDVLQREQPRGADVEQSKGAAVGQSKGAAEGAAEGRCRGGSRSVSEIAAERLIFDRSDQQDANQPESNTPRQLSSAPLSQAYGGGRWWLILGRDLAHGHIYIYIRTGLADALKML
jgi:hypothetical protein